MRKQAAQAAFEKRILDLLDSLGASLTITERAEVTHLIDHNEVGEALRTLAWIISEEDKRISAVTYKEILSMADGLVSPEHLPSDLAHCVEE